MATPRPTVQLPGRYSLRWWLPFAIATLIVLLLATFLWSAYQRVEATLIRSAASRAQRAADQIASLIDGERAFDQIRRISADPVFGTFLKTPTEDTRKAALARLGPPSGTSLRRIQLWDNAGHLMLEVSSGSERNEGAKRLPAGIAPSQEGIGPLQSADDMVFSESVAEIHEARSPPGASAPSSRRLGFLRIHSTFVESPPGIFSRLVGQDAVVRVGNRTGGLWTDFAKVAPPEPVDLGKPGMQQYRSSTGDLRIGSVALVPGAPWSVWVEFPLADVISPAREFSRDMIAIALPFVAAAVFFAAIIASRITRPLAEINRAAAAVAAGNYDQRVGTRRRDEIGQLGRAFDAMAADVQAMADALRKSEAGYRELFASNPVPMWVYDGETLRFIDVNDMAIRHYGYSRDEFLAMTIRDIRPDADVPALLESVATAPESDQAGIWRHRKKDGTLIDVEISSHALVLGGRPARMVLAHDVTARLESQRHLEESEKRFRGMAENMPHIVWTARPDSYRDYFSHHWFDYSGLDIGSTLGDGWLSAVHPDDRDALLARWHRAVQTGGEQTARYRLKRADGVYRWHVGRAAPLRKDNGDIAMWVGTMTDIDDIRRAEEALRTLNADLEQRVQARTAELEAANQELEAFSYSVSHDLRAPLRHVQGYVEMLTESAGNQLSDKSQRYLKTIGDATVEMGDLIDGLLSFSRIGRVQMAERRVLLDEVVRSVIDGLQMATGDRDIQWQIGPLPAVQGDPSLLKQVYSNLIGNAVKYTSRRDRAVIEIGRAGDEDGRSVLFVRDNGAGFDMRYAHKLFGVFQRLHSSDEFEGTGIGLATVRRIVARHGGRTWAEGEPGVGAVFYLTLQPSPENS